MTTISASSVYDVVLFGASGFTGKYVLEELIKHSQSASPAFTFAIAGRNEHKLQEVLRNINKTTASAFSNIPIIVADVKDLESLKAIASSCKVLINCVGPYRFYGFPVVEACLSAGCNYVDISGEPQFMEECRERYHQQAVSKHLSIISACGFDSIPADIGVYLTIQKMQKSTPQFIESFIEVENSEGRPFRGHFTTFESAVHGFSEQKQLQTLRDRTQKSGLTSNETRKRKTWPFYEPRLGKWCVPFPGSDPSVVRRSISALKEGNIISADIRYAAYFATNSFFSFISLLIFAVLFYVLTKFEYGKQLLLKYPEFFTANTFSRQGPSREDIDSTFFTIKFFGHGSDDKQCKFILSGPGVLFFIKLEPGYCATPIFVTQAALTLIKEEKDVAKGVITPVTAFKKTKFVSRLLERGIRFAAIDE